MKTETKNGGNISSVWSDVGTVMFLKLIHEININTTCPLCSLHCFPLFEPPAVYLNGLNS